MSTLEFTPVDIGDFATIPPELPAGEWEAKCSASFALTKKDQKPMVVLEWSLTTALTEGNEAYEGSKLKDYIVFAAKTAPHYRFAAKALATMCAALGVTPPRGVISSAVDFDSFIEELNGMQAVVWTRHAQNKQSGEVDVRISYVAPRGGVRPFPAADIIPF